MVLFFKSARSFEENRLRIEDFIFASIVDIQSDFEAAIRGVDVFNDSIDKFVDTLEQIYQNPSPKDILSERSSPISDGRYRIFYKVSIRSDNNFEVTFLDIDDNRESNLDRFPTHRIRTFSSEE